MTSSGAVRAVAWVVGAVLLAGGTAGCGLRDRTAGAGDAGGAGQVAGTVADAGSTSGAGTAAGGGTAGAPSGGAVRSAAPKPVTPKPAAVSAGQVARVEAVVGAASQTVSQGEAAVASDG